jgi:selenocysteine-specific elongation factor
MRSLVVGTAGHIDHGKSALVEALTGTHPDRLKEEQARGITIDLGFAHFMHGDASIALVDVPGHERFVRNMLAGAGGIDAVMLVVAADESVMPQTREHFDICRLLGVAHGLVAVTKCDLVDQAMLALVRAELREAVAGSFLDGAPVLAVSARTGAGIDALRDALAGLAGRAPRQARPGLTRLPVDRVFTVRGFGTVVTGTLVSGRVAEGETLEALPERRPVRVRGVQVHGQSAPDASAPRRVALNLGAVETGELSRGITLATPASLPVTLRADVRLELLSSVPSLAHGARVRVHHGTSEVPARVAIAAVRTSADGMWVRAEPGRAGVVLQPGGQAYARLRLEQPSVLTRGDRIVLRTYSPATTIGGGTVLDPEPPPGRLRRAAALERFRLLEEGRGAFRTWLVESGLLGLTLADMTRRGGLGRDEAEAVREAAATAGWAEVVGDRVFESSGVARMETELLAALVAFHEAQPRDVGFPREQLRQQVAPGAPPALFGAVVERLVAGERIAGTDRLRLSTHRPELTGALSAAAARILQLVEEAGLAPPDQAALAAAAGLAPAELRDVVHALTRDGRLVRVDTLLFHVAALAGLKEDVGGLGPGTTVDVAFVKARYGLSRKYVIPLLEWLDRQRVTRRAGNARVVLGG